MGTGRRWPRSMSSSLAWKVTCGHGWLAKMPGQGSELVDAETLDIAGHDLVGAEPALEVLDLDVEIKKTR